jgi:high-affinity iron transporter
MLVHTLNYISRDYPNGVANGKVKDPDEYEEMQGFIAAADKYYEADKTLWSEANAALIGRYIHLTDSLVLAKADADAVAIAANTAKAAVIKASGMTVAPGKYPNLMDGKVIFAAQCAKCHGAAGYGDGKEGEKLDPRPRNFHDEARMGLMSPFAIYNTVRCGVQGTGMKAHPELSDEEVWNVAFYILTLRYPSQQSEKNVTEKLLAEKFSNINLEQIATLSDGDLTDKYKATKADLAVLRYNQPDQSKGLFIDVALKYIDQSLMATGDGNYEEADKLSSLAYLEGIEPIEKQLRATDPALMERLEDQMTNTRRIISERRSKSEISDSLKASKVLMAEAAKTLSGGQVTFMLALLMSISILLREGLEAFLVIMVILGIIKASGISGSMRYVHAGWILAVICGIVLWVIGGQIIQSHMAQVELMEGIIAFIAVAMLLYIGFWLHGKSEAAKWRTYVADKVKGASAGGSMLGLLVLSFFVVFREVFESVLFLSAINIESGGKQEHAIIVGVAVAFVIVLVLAWLVLKYSTRLPVPKLFKISSIVMAALAVILAGKGIHSFQETGLVSIHGLSLLPRVELLGIFATIETLMAQVLILLLVIYVMKYVNRVKVAA